MEIDIKKSEKSKNDYYKIYENIYGFRYHYLSDFIVVNEKFGTSYLDYLRNLKNIYSDYANRISDDELHNLDEETLQHFKVMKPEILVDYYIGVRSRNKNILDFIEGLINNEELNYLQNSSRSLQKSYGNIETQDIDEKTDIKYSVPQKIKILDMLNIKGWLMEKHNFTIFQIEELLSDLFDRTDKTIRSSFSDSKHENTAQQYLEELKKIKAKR